MIIHPLKQGLKLHAEITLSLFNIRHDYSSTKTRIETFVCHVIRPNGHQS